MNILVISDDRFVVSSLREKVSRDGHTVIEAGDGKSALPLVESESPDLVVLDLRLPDTDVLSLFRTVHVLAQGIAPFPIVVIPAHTTIDPAVEAMKLGATDYLASPLNSEEAAAVVRRALEAAGPAHESRARRVEHRDLCGLQDLIGNSKPMRGMAALVRCVSQSGASTVLLRGESGTGKDLIAKAIHSESSRSHKPFMNITCTALQDTLLESELFGHELGSFTDAKAQKKGLFELAHGGTVFLDEIGDISPMLQAKLLRVLEEKTFRRIGGTTDIHVDVRVIAATNRDLESAISEGKFREDLYYRINIITMDVPPLRKRMDDLPLLVQHFLGQFSAAFHKDLKSVTPEAMGKLMAYDWPGNVRELKNVMERAVVLGTGEAVGATDILVGRTGADGTGDKGASVFRLPEKGLVMEAVEKDLMAQALERTFGNQTRAAELLGITRDQMRYRMEKLGLRHHEPPNA